MLDETSARPPETGVDRPVVLVVEDDPVLSVVIRRSIESLFSFYEVVHVTSSAAALAQIARRIVPLVITDYRLPASTDGLKLAAMIRERSPETRIALITAYATPDVEQAAYTQGVDFYLPKPFLLKDLTLVVRNVLSWWQSQNQQEEGQSQST